MHSSTPKVLHRVAGRALLARVLDTAKQLSPKVMCVVHGHGGELVRQAVDENGAIWVMQEPQLGTGHAVMQAVPHLDERWPTLVLYGDVPLIRAETLKHLVEARSEEHTSELQSQSNLVCRLLLEKKKKKTYAYDTSDI